jgi:hypothetical protein
VADRKTYTGGTPSNPSPAAVTIMQQHGVTPIYVGGGGGSSVKPTPASAVKLPSTPSPPSTVRQTAPPPQTGIFTAPFFSWEGQGERISNVFSTLGAAIGLVPGGVTAHTGNYAGDIALGTAANHPFITAGLGAVGYTALGLGATTEAAAVGTAGTASTSAIGLSSIRTALIGGAVGLGAGLLLGGGGSQTSNQQPSQNTSPTISPTQQSTQQPQQNPSVNPYQAGGSASIVNSPGSSLSYNQSQDTYSTFNLYQPNSQAPTQSTPSTFTPAQTLTSDQSSSSLLLPALIVGAALVLSKN